MHHKKNRKFGRERGQRRALLQSLASSLIEEGKITTSEAKAKELRPYVEKLITKSKNATLSNRRLVASRLGHPPLVKKLFETTGPKYKDRKGGYTRITKLPSRVSDGSKMAMIELI
ncbi:MAG: 50S ribosomal protein L17 [Candidatus Taylorbacteria bacterium]